MTYFTKQRLLRLALVSFCFTGHTWPTALSSEGGLTLPDTVEAAVEVLLPAELDGNEPSQVLQIFVGKAAACCENKSPIAGSYRANGRSISFDPAFDFVEGQSYTVKLQEIEAAGKKNHHLTEFSLQTESDVASPEVVAIYPSGAKIPENTLRFYIHFSTPMKPHMSNQFIKLVDADGDADMAAFMTFKQELWNEDRTRLTLLMDPGRIKRGVAQNLTLGPALLEGNRYSIVVDEGWLGASGEQTAPRFEQSFVVSEALRTLPDTDLWQIRPPKMATREPLVIEFDRPFDLSLAQSSVTVFDQQAQLVPGIISVNNNERTWRFRPDHKWDTAALRIVVDARLEDVSGNNFRELLDHSIETSVQTIDQLTIALDLDSASK